MMMKNGMSYEAAHEAAKAYYNAVKFNLYHADVIMQMLSCSIKENLIRRGLDFGKLRKISYVKI